MLFYPKGDRIMDKDKVRTSIVISKDLKAKVEEIAKKENRSFANMVNTALIKFVKEYPNS